MKKKYMQPCTICGHTTTKETQLVVVDAGTFLVVPCGNCLQKKYYKIEKEVCMVDRDFPPELA